LKHKTREIADEETSQLVPTEFMALSPLNSGNQDGTGSTFTVRLLGKALLYFVPIGKVTFSLENYLFDPRGDHWTGSARLCFIPRQGYA